jgi:putative sigma-54 modulation protein
MQIEYTGRQTEVTPRLRALAERRLRKLAKMLRTITRAHVILSRDKHRRIAEVSVHSPHLDLTAQEQTADMTASLGTVFDKLESQAQKQAGKRKERKRRGPARGAAGARRGGALFREAPRDGGAERPPAPASRPAPRPERPSAAAPRLIRTRPAALKPMTVEEAMREVEESREGLVVFRDAETERVTVLFKRKDGNLGLIEPEA